MNKFQAVVKTVGRFVDDNLPTILSVLALGGLGASVATAIKETPKAMEALEAETHKKLFTSTDDELEKMNAMRVDEKPENYTKLGFDAMATVGRGDEKTDIILYNQKNVLTTWDKVKAVAPVYWPCALTTIATGACIVTSTIASKRKYLGLAALVAAKSKELEEYQDKVKELFGEKKANEVDKELAKDQIMACPREIDDSGMTEKPIMYFCGTYWRATQEEVRAVFNRWNQEVLENCTYPVNGDDNAKIIDDECELHLEALLDDYLAPEFKIAFRDTWAYKRMTWDITKGVVEPRFNPGETGSGRLGYVIKPNRDPDHYYDVY